MRVIITGGTGLIGRALAADLLKDDHEVILLSRRPGRPTGLSGNVRSEYWDARTAEGWGALADGAAAIVNLAGDPLASFQLIKLPASRWTPARRRRIVESRANAGKAVVEAVKAAEEKPRVVIQSSAVGYYGGRTDDLAMAETSPPGDDFLAKVCVQWEAATVPVEKMGVRRAIIRTSLVLSNEDGSVFPLLALQSRLFTGGALGSGQQYFSWIHLTDQVAALRFLIENDEASGSFNLSAPNPIKQADLSKLLGRLLGRPSFWRIPGFLMRLGLGELSTLVLEGQRALPTRLQEMGFQFKFPEAEAALRDLLE